MPTTPITASTQAPLIKEFIRGGTYTLSITVTSSTGAAFDLTGCTVFFTINASSTPSVDATDSTAILKASTSSFVTPTSGVATITLTAAATAALAEGDYWYDVKLKDASANMTPLGKNKIKVVDNITTRTS